MTKISNEIIDKLAVEFNLEPLLIRTVIRVESAGKAFHPRTGRIMIQFEPRWFRKYTGISIINKVDYQSKEWKAFNKAVKIDEEAAYLATSWGLGQVMGFNHKRIGYCTAKEMAEDFIKGEEQQLRGMLSFIRSYKSMYQALKTKNWKRFAYKYNGPNYSHFSYDTKLANAFAKESTTLAA